MKNPNAFLLKYGIFYLLLFIAGILKAQATFQGIRLSSDGNTKDNDENSNEKVISINTNQIVDFIKSSNGSPSIIPFKMDETNLLLEISIDPSSAFLNSSVHSLDYTKYTSFVLRGKILDNPQSKVWLAVGKGKIICGTIVSNNKIYRLQPFFSEHGYVPNACIVKETDSVIKLFLEKSRNTDDLLCEVFPDVVLQIDQAFVDEFNGDVQAAKIWALNAAHSMETIWVGMEAPDGSSILQFDFFPRIVFFPDPYSSDDLYNTTLQTWSNNILGDWSNNRPCLRKDGIIYLTGRQGSLGGTQGSAKGITHLNQGNLCENPGSESGGRVSIVIVTKTNNTPDLSETAETMAHELGHQLGLCGHENESSSCGCNNGCEGGLLMCQPSSGRYMSTCMQAKLNQALANEPNINRCPCLSNEIIPYVTENCERCYAKPTSVIADNIHPVKGCSQGRQIINVTATLKGGCNPAEDVPVRVKYDHNRFKPLLNAQGNIVSNYFNVEYTMIQGGSVAYKELRRVLNPPDSNGPEDLIDHLNLGEEMVVTFSLLFDPAQGVAMLPNAIEVYIGTQNGENAGFVTIAPYYDISVMSGQSVLDVIPLTGDNRFFHVIGDLTIPEIPYPAPSGNYITSKPNYRFNGYHFVINDGNKIELEPSVYAEFRNSNVEGCNTMWKGFELGTKSGIFLNESTVKDAQKAVNAQEEGSIYARLSTFLNNDISIFVDVPAGKIAPWVALLGNTFETTPSSGLKPPFAGQFPLPSSAGYSGVYLNSVTAVDVDILDGTPNQFSNLRNGIISQRSNLIVGQSKFNRMLFDGSISSGYPVFSKGKGIYANGGILLARGEEDGYTIFEDCHTGIETTGTTSTTVWYTDMDEVKKGIITKGGLNNLQHNFINAESLGIGAYFQSGLGAGTQVRDNVITMEGSPYAAGILTGGNYIATNPIPSVQEEGNIIENQIDMLDGATAIQVIATDKITVARNIIGLENSQNNKFGISLFAGDNNALGCNDIVGLSGDGIHSVHASRPTIWCNTTDGTSVGIRIEGVSVGKSKADISGNTMKNNGLGLLLGVDAVIGTQEHRGNIWEGTDAMAGTNAAQNSLFIVDENENPEFLPITWFPLSWFNNISDSSESFNCGPINQCISLDPGIIAPLDEVIARGDLAGEYYQEANNWLAQRRLSERISIEGNPYPGNGVIDSFLVWSQFSGLAAYANVQTGIRNVFEPDANSKDNYSIYESSVVGGLVDVALIEKELHTLEITEQDSISLTEQRDSILEIIRQASFSRDTVLYSIISSMIFKANNLTSENDNLNNNNKEIERNEKKVNTILLKSIAQGNFSFSAQDSLTLSEIANLCPLSDGEVVYRARAMLYIMQDDLVTYDDTCIQERSQKIPNTEVAHFKIYPIPASDIIVLSCDFNDQSDKKMHIINTFGQLTQEILLSGQPGNQQISIGGLKEGIYWYVVTDIHNSLSLFSGKIIVIR